MSRAKELTKNALIITVGRISTQFITFLLLPMYTTLLTTSEYGMVDLITTLVQLFVPVISLMIDQGVFRYLLSCENEKDRKAAISSAFFILTALNVVFLLIYCIVAPFLNLKYKIWVILIAMVMGYSNLFLQVARGLKRTGDYALGSFVCSTITIILNVLCIAFLKMDSEGMLFASFSGNFICCLYLFYRLKIQRYISIKEFDRKLARYELKYSVPLVPNQLSLWIMNSSDKLMVSVILGTAANGVLAVSHKFSSIYMTFFNIFLLAWHETGAMHYFDEDRDEFFSIMLKKVITVFSTLCMGIIVVLPLVFNWFVNSAYKEAYYQIPIYLIASLFNVVVGLLGVVYVATKKTIEIAKTTLLAAFINIILNFALINEIELFAASISTFLGYLITMIYRVIDTRKYLKINYNVKQYTIICLGLLVCTLIYYLNNQTLSVVFSPIFILIALWINRDIVINILNFVKHRGKKN